MTDAPASGTVEDGVHRLTVRVYYEDTDAGGIVYHANYLRFFERGRSEMLRVLGIRHAAAWDRPAVGDRRGFAVRRAALDYLAPAVLDDALTVHSRVEKVAAAYLDAAQWITRGGEALVRASLRIALVDGTGRPRRLPADWRRALADTLRPEPMKPL